MKLKLSNKEIHFRLQNDELDSLLAGKTLHEKLVMPGGALFSYSVAILQGSAPIALNYREGDLCLSISRETLQRLVSAPSKEGVSGHYAHSGKRMAFSVAVDLGAAGCERASL